MSPYSFMQTTEQYNARKQHHTHLYFSSGITSQRLQDRLFELGEAGSQAAGGLNNIHNPGKWIL